MKHSFSNNEAKRKETTLCLRSNRCSNVLIGKERAKVKKNKNKNNRSLINFNPKKRERILTNFYLSYPYYQPTKLTSEKSVGFLFY